MRWIVRLLPRRFRDRFGDELAGVAADLVRDARARGGRVAQLAWLGRELISLAGLIVSLRRSSRKETRLLETGTVSWLDVLRTELRWALRQAARRPLFAVVVSATLAVCVATAATAFGLATAVLWRPLPFADAGRLVFVWEDVERDGQHQVFRVTGTRFAAWRDNTRSFEAVALFGAAGFSMEDGDGVVPVRGVRASANLFDTLRVTPVLGRGFSPGDDVAGRDAVVVLSHALWQERFGATRDVVGRTVRLSGRPYTVIGVMPPVAFPGWPVNPARVTIDSASRELWVPIPRTPELDRASRAHVFGVIGRLAAGVSLEQATAELRSFTSPSSPDPHGAHLTRFREQFVSDARGPLLALFGAAMAVVLVACTNLASLYLSAFEHRRVELAMRAALGATARRLAGQLTMEALLLAAAGGIAGALVARYALARLPELLPPSVPILTSTALDFRVAAFAAALTVLSAILLAAWPVRRLLAAGAASARATWRPRSATYGSLIVVQVGLAIALVASAALLMRSLSSVHARDPGFVIDGVAVASIGLPDDRYGAPQAVVAFEERLLSRLAARRDVAGVAVAYDHPLEANWSDAYSIRGGVAGAGEAEGQAQLRIVSPAYFAALGVEVLAGREFGERPPARGGLAGTAIVNEAFDRALGGSSIGRRLRSASATSTWGAGVPGEFDIIGIVEDERFTGLEAPSQPAIYLSTREFPQTSFSLLVRSAGTAAAGDIRRLLRELEPGATVGTPTTLAAILSEQLVARRVTTEVIGGFAGVALGLAALGLYGLLAMLVGRGTREIGLRLALGASPRTIARHVLQDGLRHALAGAALGTALALVAGRLLEGLLVGVSGRDPLTLGSIVGAVLAVATAACLVPAIRASRTDPAVALRAE